MDDEDWWPAEVWPKLGAQGYLGLTVAPAYGGMGLDFLSAGIIGEEISYGTETISSPRLPPSFLPFSLSTDDLHLQT